MKTLSTILWTCLYISFASLGFILSIRYISPESTIQLNQPTRNPTSVATPFMLTPPSQAISGILTELSGSVKHKTRESGDFTEATKGALIRLGESIATETNAQAIITIPSITTTQMKQNSELVFANIFRENTVLIQKSGTILYSIPTSNNPVAIRALHSLISASDSTIQINIIDTDVTVSVHKGSAKLAIVDGENVTHVYTIPEGNRAIIDDTYRSVRIRADLPR